MKTKHRLDDPASEKQIEWLIKIGCNMTIKYTKKMAVKIIKKYLNK